MNTYRDTLKPLAFALTVLTTAILSGCSRHGSRFRRSCLCGRCRVSGMINTD